MSSMDLCVEPTSTSTTTPTKEESSDTNMVIVTPDNNNNNNASGGDGGGVGGCGCDDRDYLFDDDDDEDNTDMAKIQELHKGCNISDYPCSISFHDYYDLNEILGEGHFATVKRGIRKKSPPPPLATNTTTDTMSESNNDNDNNNNNHQYFGGEFAIKIISKSKLKDYSDIIALQDEVTIQKELHHSNIIHLYETYQDIESYYLVLESVDGGELFDRITQKEYYTEKEARDALRIIFNAIAYCHEKRIAHRDLKAENLLLKSPTDDTTILIADFGFAKRVPERNSLKTMCGTPAYVAPEILNETLYDERADNWSLGVIAYILLGGYPPFRNDNDLRALFQSIRDCDYCFHDAYWSEVSTEAKNLIRSLLNVDRDQRATASSALKFDPWIVYGDDEKLSRRSLLINLEELRKFNVRRKFRGAVDAVIATNRLTFLGQDFRQYL